MILALVILGVALLVVATFIPPPGKTVANIVGAVFLVIGLVLLVLALVGGTVAV